MVSGIRENTLVQADMVLCESVLQAMSSRQFKLSSPNGMKAVCTSWPNKQPVTP